MHKICKISQKVNNSTKSPEEQYEYDFLKMHDHCHCQNLAVEQEPGERLADPDSDL